MSVVPDIIEAFGGVNALANATGFAQQTVSEWGTRCPPEIPPWRRPAVADAAHRLRKPLSDDALAYLASRTRTPKASPEQAAA